MSDVYLHLAYPILLCSDCHGHVETLDKIKESHPEILNRIFLGDLFDFIQPVYNYSTGEWLKKNVNDWRFILGNHDCEVARFDMNISSDHKKIIFEEFKVKIQILVEGDKYLVLHSKPKGLADFINPGYTYRELTEDFIDHDKYKAIVGGHVHRETKHVFQDTDTELWQLGAVKDRKYAILTKKGIEYKMLKL